MHSKTDESTPVNRLVIAVSNYHDGEYPIAAMTAGAKADFHTLWDYGYQELLESVNGGLDEKADELFHRFLDEQLRAYHVKPLDDPDYGMTIYVVRGTPENVLDVLWRYTRLLMEDVAAGGPGADDGTYDYFPGAVDACRQIALGFIEQNCYAATARVYYNELVDAAKRTHYLDNPEADDLLLPLPSKEVADEMRG